jgi:uncharacterized protein YkwD
MRLKSLLGQKTAAIVVMGVIGLGLAGCKPTTAPTTTTSSGGPSDPYVSQLFSSLNADRTGAGLPAFAWNGMLASNAAAWAQQMANANSLYHQNLGALLASPSYAGFHTIGENILVGPSTMTPQQMEAAWKASPPHWANITNGAFNQVGIGVFRGADGRLWAAQEFGG